MGSSHFIVIFSGDLLQRTPWQNPIFLKKIISKHKNMFLINEICFKVFYLNLSKETAIHPEC